MWSRRKPDKHQRSRGFMLVEVLVTAAVAAVLLAVLMRGFSTVWGGIGAVREETEAMLVARAVIDASTPRNNLAPLTQEGKSGKYAWRISIVNTGLQSTTGQQNQSSPSFFNASGQQDQRPTTFFNASGQQNQNPDQRESDQPRDEGQEGQARPQELPWTLFRIAVAVLAPSGRRTTLETFRVSRPAAR